MKRVVVFYASLKQCMSIACLHEHCGQWWKQLCKMFRWVTNSVKLQLKGQLLAGQSCRVLLYDGYSGKPQNIVAFRNRKHQKLCCFAFTGSNLELNIIQTLTDDISERLWESHLMWLAHLVMEMNHEKCLGLRGWHQLTYNAWYLT